VLGLLLNLQLDICISDIVSSTGYRKKSGKKMQDTETQRKKQTDPGLVPVFIRLPADIKAALETRAQAEKVSQAALAARILGDALADREADSRVSAWLAKL
jgi:hypothetical protein